MYLFKLLYRTNIDLYRFTSVLAGGLSVLDLLGDILEISFNTELLEVVLDMFGYESSGFLAILGGFNNVAQHWKCRAIFKSLSADSSQIHFQMKQQIL